MSKILFPDNIFTRFILSILPQEYNAISEFSPSALILRRLLSGEADAALMPVLDLISLESEKDLAVSSKAGIAFDAVLSNSYLYFSNKADEEIAQVKLTGDVSKQEMILAKIIFNENYRKSPELVLSESAEFGFDHMIIVGDDNFVDEKYAKGISLSEQVMEITGFPYVNYVLASKSKAKVAEIENVILDIKSEKYRLGEESNLLKSNTSAIAAQFIEKNLSNLELEFTEEHKEGIMQLMGLPFMYGIADDIKHVQFA